MNDLSEIPNGTKKVCTSCFTRIMRKINQHSGGNCSSPAQPDAPVPNSSGNGPDSGSATVTAGSSTASTAATNNEEGTWTDEQIEQMKVLLKANGRNWSLVAERLVGGKSAEQCKKFFYARRKKLNLDKIVLEYKRVSKETALSHVAASLTLTHSLYSLFFLLSL